MTIKAGAIFGLFWAITSLAQAQSNPPSPSQRSKPDSDWKTISDQANGFSIEMPGTTKQETFMAGKAPPRPVTKISSQVDKIDYIFSYCTVHIALADQQRMVHESTVYAAKQNGAVIIRESTFKIGNVTGYENITETPIPSKHTTLVMRTRNIHVGDRLYKYMTAVQKAMLPQPGIDRFMNSLRLLPPPEQKK